MRMVCAVVVSLLVSLVSGAGKHKPVREPSSDELAEGFVYPSATKHGASYGGGITPAYLATFVTTDDGEKVLLWYEEKIGKVRARSTGISWGGYEGYAVTHDDSRPSGPQGAEAKPRPAAVSVFTERTSMYTITIVVSRAVEEEHTHIALTLTKHPSE